jgi:hypothetical protein
VEERGIGTAVLVLIVVVIVVVVAGGAYLFLKGGEPDFEVSANPASISIPQYSSENVTITIRSINGFSSSVSSTWEHSGGVELSDIPFHITPPPNGENNQTLTIEIPTDTPTGEYWITGTYGENILGSGKRHIVNITVTVIPGEPPSGGKYTGSGSGTARDPYIITTVEQLQEMENNLTAHYALGNDIDASDTINWNGSAGFEPVGTEFYKFTGSLDGRVYRIYNLYINRGGANYVGLFAQVGSGGVVENLGLENEYVSGSSYVGGLIGDSNGTVSNCYSTGSVSGGYVGGIVGYSEGGTISNCYSTDSVSGGSYAGGIVGLSQGGTISNCYSTGPVSGGSHVGGLVGNNSAFLSYCYSTGSVSGDGFYAGGLVGNNNFIVSNCYSTGSVSGNDGVGGLIGANWGSASAVSYCYSTGSVSGGGSYVGGLVGGNNGTVSYNSFWDKQTSGQATSAGGTGKTTEEMKNVRTYTDMAWDFVGNPYSDVENVNIWNISSSINSGYPFLAWQVI